jgi:hypothetical protein
MVNYPEVTGSYKGFLKGLLFGHTEWTFFSLSISIGKNDIVCLMLQYNTTY